MLDLPTGATIVGTFGLTLLVLAGARKAFFKPAGEAAAAREVVERRAIRA